jgi:hypothetical protein
MISKELKNLSRCWVGKLTEDGMFESTTSIHRRNPDEQITFLNEKYIRVNNEHNCYIKMAEFKEKLG